ncbi:sensor histidine kinase [Streptomyces sp. NPDC004539]|uniref:sensor histidine kinase n=1 Tax=Streptomyces sp. NPDC004539 TaxID=3154280 RepID=UPI0033AE6E31
MLPWLLIGVGAFSNLLQAETPNPWIGGLGLLTFNSLYIYVVFRAFLRETREATSTRFALALLALVTCALAIGYGGTWLLFFPLLGLATGAAVRMPHLRWVSLALATLAGTVGVLREGWGSLDTAYTTWISTLVTAAVLSLADTVRELRSAREELARRAVEKERLRFSRDLHDLLGHTLSVIVVKSEAARRLAPRNLEAALTQITDIESVGRQALTEIREAVTGYRESTFTTELDRSRSTLTTAGISPTITESGPPLSPQTAALLGWVVREAVTNIVRHSGATHCAIVLTGTPDRVRLTVTDDGPLLKVPRTPRTTGPATADRDDRSIARDTEGPGDNAGSCNADGTGGSGDPGKVGDCGDQADPLNPPTLGTGLIGLRERLAAAGGTLEAGPGVRGGFTVTAELPTEAEEYDGGGSRWDPVFGAGSVDGWHPEPCAPGVYTVRPTLESRHTAPSPGSGPRLSP